MVMDKVKIMLVVLLVAVTGGSLLGYLAMSKEEAKRYEMLTLELKMEQAVREVEVSIWEAANSVFYYMVQPSAVAVEEYKKQLKDVEEFMSAYKKLISSEQQKSKVAKFEKMWADLVLKAEELIALRDKLTELKEEIIDSVHDTDDVIDYKIQAALVEGIPQLIAKERAVREVEVSIWEAANAALSYTCKPSAKTSREFFKQLDDVNEFWQRYTKLNITSGEEPHIKEFEESWNRCRELFLKESQALADEINTKYLVFWETVHAVDDVIDFEIQAEMKQ